MLVVPATARLQALCHLDLVVSNKPDVTQRVLATCCRRQGTVVALVLSRRGETADLELAVEVEPHLRRGLIDRIAGLVDVREVRDRAARGSGG
jgi:acetolactate synthase regulatory subunit